MCVCIKGEWKAQPFFEHTTRLTIQADYNNVHDQLLKWVW